MTLDTRIIYKTHKYTNVQKKVIREFGKQLLIEVGENSEGVMLPRKFGKMQLILVEMNGVHRKTREIFQNYHSDGYIGILTYLPRHQGYTIKYSSFITGLDHFRFRSDSRAKQFIKNIMFSGKWIDHLKFSTFKKYFKCIRFNKC